MLREIEAREIKTRPSSLFFKGWREPGEFQKATPASRAAAR
jgi:hypothetical protein